MSRPSIFLKGDFWSISFLNRDQDLESGIYLMNMQWIYSFNILIHPSMTVKLIPSSKISTKEIIQEHTLILTKNMEPYQAHLTTTGSEVKAALIIYQLMTESLLIPPNSYKTRLLLLIE